MKKADSGKRFSSLEGANDGKYTPERFTRVDNQLLEALIATPLPGRYIRIVLAISRETHGYNRTYSKVSLSTLQRRTKIDRRDVHKILRELRGWRVVERGKQVDRRTSVLRINTDPETWKLPKKKTGKLPKNLSVQAPTWSNPYVGSETAHRVGLEADQTGGAGADTSKTKDNSKDNGQGSNNSGAERNQPGPGEIGRGHRCELSRISTVDRERTLKGLVQ